jgi:hypothetical protein
MNELILPMWGLVLIFMAIAFTYSSVGLGGGSSYTAVLAVTGVSIIFIPTVSLLLNILVSSLGTYHFTRYKHVNFRVLLPFLVSSMPMSFLGGSLHLEKEIFQYILLFSLVLVVLRIYFWDQVSLRIQLNANQSLILSIISGGILGLIAGIVGIGGGIYLAPLVLLFNLGTVKEAAGCAVIFVFLNSFTGLLGRANQHQINDVISYWPLVLAVIVGGFLGSRLGAISLNPKIMEKVLGGILIFAIIIIFDKLF